MSDVASDFVPRTRALEGGGILSMLFGVERCESLAVCLWLENGKKLLLKMCVSID